MSIRDFLDDTLNKSKWGLLLFYPGHILIDLRMILQKNYTVDNLPFVEDQLVAHYSGQNLCFYGIDGNNVLTPGLIAWIQMIQHGLNIPDNKISFISVSPSLPQWEWIPYKLEAFDSMWQYITPDSVNTDTSSAKFVGLLAGSRFSVSRLRLAYNLDCAFPNDAFITFPADRAKNIINERLKDHYQNEINWFSNRKFNNDLNNTDSIDYRDGAGHYVKIWNRYHIEIITETDDYQNFWFTDKTAKCLCTGKPFLLLSGRHSLQNLKQMGFVTFNQWIDESYDDCVLPGQRINAIINSLQKLYHNPAKDSIIAEMQQHARQNINHYHRYVQPKIPIHTHP
jgi:hypothetical protein